MLVARLGPTFDVLATSTPLLDVRHGFAAWPTPLCAALEFATSLPMMFFGRAFGLISLKSRGIGGGPRLELVEVGLNAELNAVLKCLG